MLHMGYSSPLQKIDSIQWHTGGDMIAFLAESTRLDFIIILCLKRTLYEWMNEWMNEYMNKSLNYNLFLNWLILEDRVV